MSYSEIKNKEVTTRKLHQCCWCGERIKLGDKAQSRTYNMDGDLVSDYMHPECNVASIQVVSDEGCFIEWQPGDFKRGSTETY
jgi:hypothetical protein